MCQSTRLDGWTVGQEGFCHVHDVNETSRAEASQRFHLTPVPELDERRHWFETVCCSAARCTTLPVLETRDCFGEVIASQSIMWVSRACHVSGWRRVMLLVAASKDSLRDASDAPGDGLGFA